VKNLIISAPFGNYLTWPCATSTLGTFTLNPRGGLLYRAWRCLRTLRYQRRLQGWVNKLGLPNPGVHSLDHRKPDLGGVIVSVHGFTAREWESLARAALWLKPAAVEFNLSCPNVAGAYLGEVQPAVEWAVTHWNGSFVIAKLPPVRWLDWAVPLYDLGVRGFHCCNTIPTPSGGLSGKVLMQYSLWAIDDLRKRYGRRIIVIGGGGVSTPQDVRVYRAAGADKVAVGSTLLNPLNWRKVPALAEAAGEVLA
jgi:dihydroorotate dehydrogenase